MTWFLFACCILFLAVGLVGGYGWGRTDERRGWLRASQSKSYLHMCATKEYVVMPSGRFFTNYHNPLVTYRRQAEARKGKS